ncbi:MULTISPECIES: shikimate kinase [Thermodesulfovibrio]|jgi:shikimate kinase|uniref:Shikimate kinase n=1 Tax=Thermodesulfovibrio yellowstonii (strain ATCC 51303 / DSM 11347 / YP87) TaxID=289376 RepID=AROK_THEYD|nr:MULTISPECIES: shikimate kinase [Thermodesulfovibrio]B5YHI3.1 RecName: Full=Shikimate kinase; Short=SK [Thermodesulfovibrio yellowstonii DSM 11347]ACI21496.1 shikimate kinase [Thermodesulfovibrio yellowstonii DSM 11347]MDI6865253.1 shikimate kinase [Thermodesulfovibrio yellowstonii]
MKNIVLIGFMGTGKTSVGKLVAKKLGFDFVDVDEVIEKATGMEISEIFSKFGESRFRDIEEEMIKLITPKKRQVIATGGGVVLRDENMKRLKKDGVIFCLRASENVIFERLKQTTNRPLLQVENPEERIKELLQKRMPLYEKADFCIDTEGLTPEEVAEKIIKEYERLSNGKT